MGRRSVIFGPVVEKPNKHAFLTNDPTELFLNGEFTKLPILATYTSNEGLMFEHLDRCAIESGKKICICPPNTQEYVPLVMKEKMDDLSLSEISSEMEKAYYHENSAMKKCLVSIYYLSQLNAFLKLLHKDICYM